ncbi:PREDICTED: uncharacterized protein LOC102030543 [Chinchilla lanigera]|uniref:uncharacterized protein LOC102030543 n=1 Tax=Chinchilla lanigera TaxID=34839 RepID=UPI00038EA42D|nr:PREDICTED: uncharacterized protein LOC102030543 [Chinchilla lanigera]
MQVPVSIVHPRVCGCGTGCDITRSLPLHCSQPESPLRQASDLCDPTMDRILSCCVIFGLLGTGHMEPGVRQTPSHKITEKGQNVTLRCDPISDPQYIYWYRQTVEKGIEFMVYFYDNNPVEKAEFFRDRFSAEMPEDLYSILKIQHLQLGDSAMYLCAGLATTASHRRFLSLCKPCTSPPPQALSSPSYLRRQECVAEEVVASSRGRKLTLCTRIVSRNKDNRGNCTWEMLKECGCGPKCVTHVAIGGT